MSTFTTFIIIPARGGLSSYKGYTLKDNRKKQAVKQKSKKRPFVKSDLEAVLKAATKPLKKEQAEKESEGT